MTGKREGERVQRDVVERLLAAIHAAPANDVGGAHVVVVLDPVTGGVFAVGPFEDGLKALLAADQLQAELDTFVDNCPKFRTVPVPLHSA